MNITICDTVSFLLVGIRAELRHLALKRKETTVIQQDTTEEVAYFDVAKIQNKTIQKQSLQKKTEAFF